MRIRSLKLKDVHFGNQWFDEAVDRWDYGDYKNNPDWRHGWISFDCACHNPADDRVYCGISSFNSEIFKAYDRKTGEFVDLGYEKIADYYDAKFHRSLVLSKDGCLYAAIALYHDLDSYFEAPGSPIVKYDPVSGSIAKMAIPSAHTYVQAIALDDEARMIYCLCFPPEKLTSFNLQTGQTRELGMIGPGIEGMAQGENIVIDDQGCVWNGWAVTRAWQYAAGPDSHRLFKYDPRLDRIVFFRKGLPRPDGRRGSIRAEAYFNFHDGFLYASGANGSFFRVDTETADAEFLFCPTPDRPSRLASMARVDGETAYAATGREGKCEFMRVDYRRGTFEKLGPIVDEAGTAMWQCHDIIHVGGGVFYLCENDNPRRSGYLWEISLEGS